ncbi:hypothetical protein J8273_8345 [Carpediemonas membranifera]|uniref:RING-type domain-containing protein n=1 Tax=Carpediemonas membranifera TaxID=201153 RepID=A0A8J6ARF3_9EUKA|nr:hypothetical protein J8273_8345 [Carpediemonas membranifera]|eukprot:KAG9390305.1 hypothetical protein J8273_8345 [Carpediemonas membranifera]
MTQMSNMFSQNLCPICRARPMDVSLDCGHSYCSVCVSERLARTGLMRCTTCSGCALSQRSIFPNFTLRALTSRLPTMEPWHAPVQTVSGTIILTELQSHDDYIKRVVQTFPEANLGLYLIVFPQHIADPTMASVSLQMTELRPSEPVCLDQYPTVALSVRVVNVANPDASVIIEEEYTFPAGHREGLFIPIGPRLHMFRRDAGFVDGDGVRFEYTVRCCDDPAAATPIFACQELVAHIDGCIKTGEPVSARWLDQAVQPLLEPNATPLLLDALAHLLSQCPGVLVQEHDGPLVSIGEHLLASPAAVTAALSQVEADESAELNVKRVFGPHLGVMRDRLVARTLSATIMVGAGSAIAHPTAPSDPLMQTRAASEVRVRAPSVLDVDSETISALSAQGEANQLMLETLLATLHDLQQTHSVMKKRANTLEARELELLEQLAMVRERLDDLESDESMGEGWVEDEDGDVFFDALSTLASVTEGSRSSGEMFWLRNE